MPANAAATAPMAPKQQQPENRRSYDAILATLVEQGIDRLHRLEHLESQMECVLGELTGTDGIPGLRTEMRNLKQWQEKWDRFISKAVTYIFVPLLLGYIIFTAGFVWALISGTIQLVRH